MRTASVRTERGVVYSSPTRNFPKDWVVEVFFASRRGSDGSTLRAYAGLLGEFDLIVTCAECSTRFKLDEARIPVTGAQVRCSRCKHAFFLPNPTASESEAMHAAAAEAAEAPDGPVPATTADLNSASMASSGAALDEPDLDEEDWQFSEEIRVEGDDLEERLDSGFGASLSQNVGGADDFENDFGEHPDFSEGFVLDKGGLSGEIDAKFVARIEGEGPQIARDAFGYTGEGWGLESEAGPEVAGPVLDESIFGSVDDFSELMEDDDEIVEVEAGSDEMGSHFDSEAYGVSSPGGYGETGPVDDLGDPESWDLVGSDDLAAGRSVMAKSSSPAGSSALSERVTAEGFFGDDANGEAPFAETSAGAAFLFGPVARVGRTMGWVAAVALVVGICSLALQSEGARWAQVTQHASAGHLTAETLRAGWVETSRTGAVLRFEGQLLNTSSQAVWPGAVQLSLLDTHGSRLAILPISAGTPLAESTLRESSAALLASSVESAMQNFVERPLAPGEVRPFQAILLGEQVPPEARRVLLEVSE
jgi:predicted Zn finger-like uncharacterized protein